MSHLAFDDPEFSKRCLDWLMFRLPNVGVADLRAYMMAVESLVLLPDRMQMERANRFVAYFAKVCSKDIVESYLAFSYVTDMLIKLALRSETIRKKMQEDREKFEFVGGWLRRHAYPAEGEIFWEKMGSRIIEVRGELPSERKTCAHNDK